jgi:hypothetical protein
MNASVQLNVTLNVPVQRLQREALALAAQSKLEFSRSWPSFARTPPANEQETLCLKHRARLTIETIKNYD